MRLPDPIANTTTEAYLAYKAGVLAKGDLKPKLYEPYIHLDAWLAYWTGLTKSYPVKNVGKNLFDKNTDVLNGNYYLPGNIASTRIVTAISSTMARTLLIRLQEGQTYTIQKKVSARFRFGFTTTNNPAPDTDGVITSRLAGPDTSASVTFTVPKGSPYFVCNFFSDDQAADAQNGYDTIVNSIQIEEGSTATSYEPYTGEPEILTDEEAYVAYLSGVTDTYPQEFRDPADIRVAAYLRYLISARFGRPEYPVTNEELYLSMLKTKYIPSGDPSSDIVIDGTAKAPFVDVKMYGDTFQQSYTGKNLFATPAGDSSSGVTFTLNPDGTYDISGTATAQAQIVLYISSPWPWLENGETYTIKANQPLGDVMVRVEAFSEEAYLRTNYILDSTTQQQTGTWNGENAARCCFVLRVASGKTVNISGLGIQLEKGSTATSFEKFVGGQPIPSPDYPQPIQTVTGLQAVEIQGKNLWGGFVSDFSRTSQGVSYTNKADGTILANGTSSGNALSLLSSDATSNGRIITLQAGDYVLSGGTSTVLLQVVSSSGEEIAETASDGVKAFTLSVATGIFVRARMTRDTVADNVAIYPQLEKGSTATTYEPYSSNDYEINLGKNLFDKSSGNILAGYVPGSTIVAQEINRVVWIKCEPNTTYTISTRAESWSREVFTTKIVPAVGVAVTKLGQIGSGENSFTVQTGATAQFLAIRIWQQYLSGISLEAELGYLQIELGSQATTYAPYFTPIELCKLGTHQDYIYKDGDSWKVHKENAKATFNGTEAGWNATGSSQAAPYFINLAERALWNYCDGISTHFKNKKAYPHNNGEFAIRTEGITISFNKGGLASLDEWLSWLGSNNVTAYYPLAVGLVTDTAITNQALIDQLEALVAGGAENGITYIKVNATDPNLPGLLYVEAPKYE